MVSQRPDLERSRHYFKDTILWKKKKSRIKLQRINTNSEHTTNSKYIMQENQEEQQ